VRKEITNLSMEKYRQIDSFFIALAFYCTLGPIAVFLITEFNYFSLHSESRAAGNPKIINNEERCH